MLKEKHPPTHPNSRFPPLVEGTISTQIAICEEDVCHAIRSFPWGFSRWARWDPSSAPV